MAVDALARAIAAGKVPVTAYEMAVKAGYTGTEEQFAEDMGNSGTNAANAAASASAAAASAESVSASAAQIATNTSDISDLKTHNSHNVLSSPAQTVSNYNGITWKWDGIDKCTFSGTSTGLSFIRLYWVDATSMPEWMVPGKKYPVEFASTNPNVKLNVMFWRNGSVVKENLITGNGELSVPSNAEGALIRLQVANGNALGTGGYCTVRILNTKTNEQLLADIASALLSSVQFSSSNSVRILGTSSEHKDLNNYNTPGSYYVLLSVDAAYVDHAPTTTTGYRLLVMDSSANDRQYQIALLNTIPGSIAFRFKSALGWENQWTFINNDLPGVKAVVGNILADSEPVGEIYTDFEDIAERWTVDGALAPSSYDYLNWHTKPVKIRGGADYYTGYVQSTACMGAFFDSEGQWIAPLRGSLADTNDFTEITASYTGGENTYSPDNAAVKVYENGSLVDDVDVGYYPASTYMKLYKFTAPANAAYVSLNIVAADNQYRYRCFVASRPIFMLSGSGNYVIRKDDPLYQKYKNKKLCVIGPSYVMINRLARNADDGYHIIGEETNGYIAGFQEYLKMFFAETKSLGYSGAANMTGLGASVHKISIYTRILGGEESFVPWSASDARTYTVSGDLIPDLSGYDVFIITENPNGLAVNNVGAESDTGSDTYMGALKAICNTIREQNPEAEIFLSTFQTASFASNAAYAAADEETRKLARKNAYGLIDYSAGGGFNTSNRSLYVYDGTHGNCEGNRKISEVMRKTIIGF